MANNKELDALLQILSGEQTIIQRTDQKAFTLLSILGAFMVFFIVHFTKMQLDMVIFSLIMIYFPAAMGTIYFLVRVLIPRVRGAKELNDNPDEEQTEEFNSIKMWAEVKLMISNNSWTSSEKKILEKSIGINHLNKIDDNRDIVKTDIMDKVELSSNKDVDIGLELLVNKEKVNKTDNDNANVNKAINLNDNSREHYRPAERSAHHYNNDNSDTNVIDLNSSPEVDFNNMISRGTSKIDDDLNLDRTSRLSQSEIDAFIDKNDAQTRPQLVTETDIDNLNRPDTRSRVSYKSYKSKTSHEKRVEPELVNNEDMVSRTSKKSGFNQPNMEEFQQFNFDPNKERKEKEEILWQLEKYRRLGVQGVKKYNMSSDLEEMRGEYIKIKKARELENSIKFQRKCLVAFATGTELLNSKLDFLDFKLDGWSEQVNENINEYDEVFEELHEKYKEKAKMAPEIKLMFMRMI